METQRTSDQKTEDLIGDLAEARINYDAASERYDANTDIVRDTKQQYEDAKEALFSFLLGV